MRAGPLARLIVTRFVVLAAQKSKMTTSPRGGPATLDSIARQLEGLSAGDDAKALAKRMLRDKQKPGAFWQPLDYSRDRRI